MSSFRDTFTKEESKSSLLDYDDSAALFFAGTLLLCVLLPWTYKVLSRVVCPSRRLKRKNIFPTRSPGGSTIRYCECSKCAEQRAERRAALTSWQSLFSWTYALQLVAVVFLWLIFVRLAVELSHTKEIQSFDPFEILDLQPGANDREIRKAYRVMSLKYHPDKNVNDPSAAAKFILVSKAYQSLTDEVAKRNFEKYGNPDGPGMMKVGIGLPRFLVEENHQLFILVLFFVVLLGVIPVCFILYYHSQKKYASNGVYIETLHFLGYYLNESTRVKNAPEFLAASAECRELTLRPSEQKEIDALAHRVVEPRKRQFHVPIVVRNYYLILGHMQRLHDSMGPQLKMDLDTILRKSILITQSMLEFAFMNSWNLTVQAMLEFRRLLVQALDVRSSSLLQVPHFNDEVIKHCSKGKAAAKDLTEYIRQSVDERKGLARMSPEEKVDVDAFCRHMPDVELSASIAVADENEIVVGDVATVTVKMTRANLKEGEAQGPVHAPYFPEVKNEEWWIFVSDKDTGTIYNFCRYAGIERVGEESVRFQVVKPGQQDLRILAMCDSYAGLDRSIVLGFKAFTPNEIKREVFVHPDDVALDDEPTLFQQMLGQVDGGDESSDEEEEAKPKPEAEAERFVESSEDSEEE